ncbi:MAG: TetR/AcrR family transcriptional regulator, partial [Myxococcota bacterium]
QGAMRDRGTSLERSDSRRGRSRRRGAEVPRQRLLEAGRRAFARRGLAGTHLIQHILEPAGVAVGSFYHQFHNKTELLIAILEEDSRDLQSALQRAQRPRPGRSLLDIARDSYTATFDVVDAHLDTMRILFRESAIDDPHVQEFARQQQRRWIGILTHNFQRLAPPGYSLGQIELAAELISVLTTGALAHYLRLPSGERVAARERLTDGLVRLTLGGLPALAVDEASLNEVANDPRS